MKRTALVLLLAGLVSAGCGGAGSDGSVAPLEALAPTAEPAPTTTTLAPLAPVTPVAAPKPAAVTVTTKRPAVAPQPVATTVTTAAPSAPVTPTTMTVVSDPTTTTTAEPAAPAGACSATLAKPSLGYAEEQTVTITSDQPGRKFRVGLIYWTQSPSPAYVRDLGPADDAGNGSFTWKTGRSTKPVRVTVDFYNDLGQLTPSCYAGTYEVV